MNGAAVPLATWKKDAVRTLPLNLLKIQRRIEKLTMSDPDLNGPDTVICWYRRRIQPLAHHGGRICASTSGRRILSDAQTKS